MSIKQRFIFFLLFLWFSTPLMAQKWCGFEDFFDDKIVSTDDIFKSKLNLAAIDLNVLVMKHKNAYLGFIGEHKQRLHIDLIKMSKSAENDSVYIMEGKTKVKQNTRAFKGVLHIDQIYEYKQPARGLEDDMASIVKRQGLIVVSYRFEENRAETATGIFEGKGLISWYINKKGVLCYDDIEDFSDSYDNNQFVGTWTSYKTGVKKIANWGQYRIPCAGDLDWGAAEFSPNPKYDNYSWKDYEP